MPVAGTKLLLVTVFCALLFTAQTVSSANANVSEDDELSTTPRSCTAWSDFSTLTFMRGTTTQTRRRTSNIPTLNCVGNCPSDAVVEAAHCSQMGLTDLGTPSWKCLPQFAASRNGHFAFGAIRVECEGCRRRGDSEIARGSCALFYSVVDQSASSRGRRYGQGAHYGGHPPGQHVDFLSTLLFLCFIAFVVILAKRICCPPPPPPVYCHPNGAVQGVPMHPGGYPGGYGYGGGGGFGTGMLTGLVVGDMLSRPHYGYGGGGYGGWGGDDGGAGADSGWGGGWGGGDGGGFGGSDSV